jgi:hypothetical protein
MHWELFTHNISCNHNLKKRFNVHLAIIKTAFYQLKKVGHDEVWVIGLFSTTTIDFQRSLFVLTMTKNVKLIIQIPI